MIIRHNDVAVQGRGGGAAAATPKGMRVCFLLSHVYDECEWFNIDHTEEWPSLLVFCFGRVTRASSERRDASTTHRSMVYGRKARDTCRYKI
eukprot:scaffold7232_cov92-Amphora_coffeaeformis.AAC.1